MAEADRPSPPAPVDEGGEAPCFADLVEAGELDGGAAARPVPRARPAWRAVAIPSEHGGWGLTAEPALLGLLVAPSVAGALLAVAALVAFVLRTPLEVVLVDRRRGRRLARTDVAARFVLAEGLLLVALVGAAAVLAGDGRFWIPLALALPVVAIELAYDVRSRRRRLVPELAGALAVAAVAPAVALAGGADGVLAAGLWALLAARSAASIPYVRDQVARLHGRSGPRGAVASGDIAAVALAGVAAALDRALVAGGAAVVVLVVLQHVEARHPPDRAVVLGARQSVLGLVLVLVTTAGVAVAG